MRDHVRRSTLRIVASGAIGLASLVLGESTGAAQGAPPAQAPPEVTQAIEFARASKASGRPADGVDAIAVVLKKYPANPDAAGFQIETLVELNRYDEALKTYDAYAVAVKKPDPATLAKLGRADLQRTLRLTTVPPIVRAQALERLARHGDADALAALRQQAGSTTAVSPESLAPVIALARVKDPAGEARLGEILRSGAPLERAQAIQAIGQGDVRALAPRVMPLLSDPDVNVRNAAATTLGLLQARAAVAPLRNAFENDDAGAVKMFAAVALKQLGDASADAFLEGLLKGQIAELQVIAAGAWQFSKSQSPTWDKAVRTLLGSQNELHRLRAAELLAGVDPAAARNVLTSALASPNPLLRAGAAKAFEARPELGDVALARRLVGDGTVGVRIHGAGLALALATRKPAVAGR